MQQEILKIANEFGVWVIAAILVTIVAIQSYLYLRLAYSTADKLGMKKEVCTKAFRTGLVTAIGPVVAVFIIMVGMMSVIGGPMSWMRLSIIGAAPTELTAARVGAEAVGVEFGSADYDIQALATSWWTMAINGAGWLVFVGLFSHKLELLRDKIGGGDPKWLAVLSGAAMLGVFGYLNSGDVVAGGGRLIAVIVGGVAMVVMTKLTEKFPKAKEYSLGIAMLVGMFAAVMLG
ncbi:hypothetical protein CACET_c22830 [Clostridium aceticum]|uniref:Uncharacterized protein n=1 Tax=Clostridium aceticum TaxID=84022 RepID=A0A0D8I8V3_9CLOT|nr:DUF5058 family protein [Clostridium aceticum]AKL95729.1 hypothetical protein CACET_c22830 [Clostridium aceticum]KJF26720.1 membrane protein [Clostridium aceticum]